MIWLSYVVFVALVLRLVGRGSPPWLGEVGPRARAVVRGFAVLVAGAFVALGLAILGSDAFLAGWACLVGGLTLLGGLVAWSGRSALIARFLGWVVLAIVTLVPSQLTMLLPLVAGTAVTLVRIPRGPSNLALEPSSVKDRA